MRFGLVVLALLSFSAGLLTAHLGDSNQLLPNSPLAAEKASPQDWISESQIKVHRDHVQLDIPGAQWASFADTNSMDPLLDEGSNGIQIIPTNPEQLSVGDVITYDNDGRKIIHRIVETGQDADGHYYRVKGDNNPQPDPGKIRFEDIERVLVAVVY